MDNTNPLQACPGMQRHVSERHLFGHQAAAATSWPCGGIPAFTTLRPWRTSSSRSELCITVRRHLDLAVKTLPIKMDRHSQLTVCGGSAQDLPRVHTSCKWQSSQLSCDIGFSTICGSSPSTLRPLHGCDHSGSGLCQEVHLHKTVGGIQSFSTNVSTARKKSTAFMKSSRLNCLISLIAFL